jgi:hypothetical protein
MPKVNVKRNLEITITMTEKEALWLKMFVQNPLIFDNEGSEDCAMRRLFWDAIDKELTR